MRELFRRILGHQDVFVETPYSEQEASERLAGRVESSLRSAAAKRCLFGTVSSSKVVFALYRPLFPSSFRWRFNGSIKASESGGSVLEGRFELAQFSRVFFSVWVVFTVLVGVVSVLATYTGTVGDDGNSTAYYTMLMFGGAAMIVPGILRVNQDTEEMNEIIAHCLSAGAAS